MPFHPAPSLPGFLHEIDSLQRGLYELENGPHQGRQIHYVDTGDRDAATVVMIHGNPTWSFLWRKVIAALPDQRCVAPDLLGFGLSSRLPEIFDHDLAGHADAIAATLAALDLPPFVLVGQDWGGPIAMAVGARMSDRVRGIVLANTSVLVPKRPRGTLFHRFARLPVVSDLVFRGFGFPQRALWMAQGKRSSIRGTTQRAYTWPFRRVQDRIAPLALARMVPSDEDHPTIAPLTEASEWATNFPGPTALVWGQRDPILGRAIHRHRRAFPDAPVTLTDAGHFLQEEVPDALATAILDVLDRSDDAN